MTLLNTADRIYLGSAQADRVYLGANLVWPSLTKLVQALFVKYGCAGGMWDFMDASTLRQNSNGTGTVTDGDPLGLAHDLSGNGWHMPQPTSAGRPSWDSVDGVVADGVDDRLQIVFPTRAAKKWTFGVTSNRNLGAYAWVGHWIRSPNWGAPGAALGVNSEAFIRHNFQTIHAGDIHSVFQAILAVPNSGNYNAYVNGALHPDTVPVVPTTADGVIAVGSLDGNPAHCKLRRMVALEDVEPTADEIVLLNAWLSEVMA